MNMFLVISLFSAAIARPFIDQGVTTTGAPVCTPDSADQCGINLENGWLIGTFRSTIDSNIFVTCYGYERVDCQRCPVGLHYSEKCKACMAHLNDTLNECVKPDSAAFPTSRFPCNKTLAENFCKENNYEDGLSYASPSDASIFFTCEKFHQTCQYCPVARCK